MTLSIEYLRGERKVDPNKPRPDLVALSERSKKAAAKSIKKYFLSIEKAKKEAEAMR